MKTALKLGIGMLFILTNLGLNAQTNLDSLLSVWQDPAQNDTLRILAYHQLIDEGYLRSQPDSALIMCEELILFSIEKNYPKGEAKALGVIAKVSFNRGDYPKALEYFARFSEKSKEIGYQRGVCNSLLKTGQIYYKLGEYAKALDYLNRNLKLAEEIEYGRGKANALSTIGLVYSANRDFDRALEYQKSAMALYKQLGDEISEHRTLNNIGRINIELGKYQEAIDDYNQNLLFYKENEHEKLSISIVYSNLASIYERLDEDKLALKYLKLSLAISEDLKDKDGIAWNQINIGKILIKKNNALAKEWCEKALLVAEELGSIEYQLEACECLYNANKEMRNGYEALEYHELMLTLDDSLKAEETAKKLQQMEFLKQVFEDSIATAEKERLIELAHEEEVRKKDKTRNSILAGGLFFFLLAGGLFSRVRYIRKSKAKLQVEKDRSDNLLLNILPEEIAEELKSKGKADARDFDMVSILFSDFKGFTSAAEKLSAKELVAEINTCFEAFDVIMEKYKVEKIKTIGDAYMAAGGLPVPTQDSVKNTVLAALEMQDFIGERKLKNDSLGQAAFEMRVGVHTGPVVAGIVGVKKFQYDIWGDTVNTASRVESNGQEGKVNISQATFDLLKEDPLFAFENRGKINAKGKGEIVMYFVMKK